MTYKTFLGLGGKFGKLTWRQTRACKKVAELAIVIKDFGPWRESSK
jgi:hypothetical protein